MKQNPVREPCEDGETKEEMLNPNYFKALADQHRRTRWARYSVEEVKQKYANGEIGDGELDDALEVAMKTQNVETVDGVFTTAAVDHRTTWWTPTKVYLLLVIICLVLLFLSTLLRFLL